MAVSTERIVFGLAKRLSANLIELFLDFPQFLGKCQSI